MLMMVCMRLLFLKPIAIGTMLSKRIIYKTPIMMETGIRPMKELDMVLVLLRKTKFFNQIHYML